MYGKPEMAEVIEAGKAGPSKEVDLLCNGVENLDDLDLDLLGFKADTDTQERGPRVKELQTLMEPST